MASVEMEKKKIILVFLYLPNRQFRVCIIFYIIRILIGLRLMAWHCGVSGEVLDDCFPRRFTVLRFSRLLLVAAEVSQASAPSQPSMLNCLHRRVSVFIGRSTSHPRRGTCYFTSVNNVNSIHFRSIKISHLISTEHANEFHA